MVIFLSFGGLLLVDALEVVRGEPRARGRRCLCRLWQSLRVDHVYVAEVDRLDHQTVLDVVADAQLGLAAALLEALERVQVGFVEQEHGELVVRQQL